MKNLKKGDWIQISRRGYYICDREFKALSPNTTKYAILKLQISIIFIFLSCSLRLILAVQYFSEITFSITEIIKIFSIGLFFDCLTVCYFAILPLIYFCLLPQKIFNHRKHQIFLAIIYFIFINIIIFSIFS